MPLEYVCGNAQRRRRVQAHPSINGIDFLQVLDAEAVDAGLERQKTLFVHCFRDLPEGLSADNVRIDGGVRFTNAQAVWARRADLAAALASSPEEAALYAALPPEQRMRVLVIRTNTSGDFSTYTLLLRSSATDPAPPPGFDVVLHRVDFSFKVECPSEFDVAAPAPAPAPAASEPPIDYLTRDYASFRRLMLDRLAVVAPGWTERNPADLGVTLVEVMAHAADLLSYYQDAVATEAYLGTARQRVSVRRHARMLDYLMHDGCNARAFVAFEVARNANDQVLPARSRLVTAVDAPLMLDASAFERAQGANAQVFETADALRLRAAHNAMALYTWGDEQCCLRQGATSATLDNADGVLDLRAGDLVLLEEVRGPRTGLGVDADPSRRHVVRLLEVTPNVDPLFDDHPVVDVRWSADDALPFELCLTVVGPDGARGPASLARGNVVLADHGLTVSGEVLAEVPDSGRYLPRLQRGPVTHAARRQRRQGAEGWPSAASELRWDMDDVLPAVELSEGNEWSWKPQRSLLNSGRFTREFVLEVEDDGRARARFGDGIMGMRPVGGAVLTATYRVGNGAAGNIGAEALAHVAWAQGLDWLKDVRRVRNPLAARGGVDPEPVEQVRIRAPQALQRRERAVTGDDYAELVQRHPEVQRAMATVRWTGSWHTLFLTVDRAGGRPVDASFARELTAFLERFRLTGQDLRVEGPDFVALDVVMTVHVAPGYLSSHVKAALLEAFSNGMLADGSQGFFHPDRFTFGQPVYLSQLVATAMRVPGVGWVDTGEGTDSPNRFRRWGQVSRGEWAAGALALDRLEVARLDNDPSRPENGRIDFVMRGGL